MKVLKFKNSCPVYYLCVQYAKPWPHCDCCQSLHAFTLRYNSTLGLAIFYTEGVFA